MLLIFGLRVYFRTIGQGMFHCQRCGGDRRYRERTGRRWFHLFFIPLIPLVSVGEHVRCGTCRTTYHVDVLAMPTADALRVVSSVEMASWPLMPDDVMRVLDKLSPSER